MEKNLMHGFKIAGEKSSKETGSTIVSYVHERSGAQLIHLKNQDQHMAFGIGFRTPPEDSSGVAHILEHSVLSGSRKFKTREPFMELLKSSMNTFLNAMTYADMTIYPVSSMNRKDLKNLIDVYMDSVLFPIIHEKKEIFLQEGWHYHILSEEEPITYNGVVYNEMRGAYSSPETNVAVQVGRALNAGTTYDHESGGYPYDIPSLSYEALKAFHKKYYHPSNSLIYLYGDVDLDELLAMLDQEYLSHFERRPADSALVLKDPEPGLRQLDFSYPADATQTPLGHSYLSYAVSLGRADSVTDYFANMVLNEILIHSESSPLKKALLDRQLGEDFMGLSSDTYYLDFGLAVKNASDSRLGEFVEVMESTLKKLSDDGIDEKLLLASLNRTEFRLREARGSLKGIIYFIKAMSAWRYDIDPSAYLDFEEPFRLFREQMNKGYFEKLIRERILENPAKITAVHRPQAGYFSLLDQEVQEKLQALRASLTKEQLAELIRDNQELLRFQMTEDTKEDKASIPHLEKSDIDRKIPSIEEDEKGEGESDLLWHPFASSDISYLTASFSMAALRQEDLVWAGYLSAIMSITDTEHYTYSELNNEINIYTSGLHLAPVVYKKLEDPDRYDPRFNVMTSAMGDYYPKMFEFMGEVLLRTDFSNTGRLREIFMMLRSNMEADFDYHGHELAMRRVASYFSQPSRYQEELGGVTLYDHLNRLVKNFDDQAEMVRHNLERVAKLIFSSRGLTVSLTGEAERKDELIRAAREFIQALPQSGSDDAPPVVFNLTAQKEALTSASGVQYVAKGYNIKKLGYEYTGQMTVLSSILSMDYLHNAVRARGGAYGAGISIEPSGNAVTYSYRDPNLKATVEAYDGMADFLHNLVLDEEDVKNYIIGSMTRFNPPLTASDINSLVLARRFSGSSKAEVEKRMAQAIATTKQDIMAKARMIDELMKKEYLCVVGNQARIEAEKDLFTVIRPLKQ